MKKILPYLILVVGFVFLLPCFTYAQNASSTLLRDQQYVWKARVLTVGTSTMKVVPGTDTQSKNQTITAKILEGPQQGKVVTVDNDYLLMSPGDVFYLNYTKSSDYPPFYAVGEPYRLNWIYLFLGIFILAVLFFGGMQGIRGLISLALSFLLIIYVMLPQLLAGHSPILITIGVSSLIIIVGSYITHGFNKTTSAAVIGMIGTVLVTGIFAYAAVHLTRLSGFASEESTYLNFNTQGHLDFVGLLFGSIMIGLLGVLYDVAIGQAISVEELHYAAPQLHKTTVYKRGIRIGREHIGALVNTLAIAYVGASLPLLLLFYQSNSGIAMIANREIFATEIIRILIGSLGLVLAVPITTFIAVLMIVRADTKPREEGHQSHGHSHGHHH